LEAERNVEFSTTIRSVNSRSSARSTARRARNSLGDPTSCGSIRDWPAPRCASHEKTMGASPTPGIFARGSPEEPDQPRCVYGQIGTAPAGPLNQPAAVGAGGDQFRRTRLDRPDDDDDVADKRRRDVARRRIRRTDLDVHDGFERLNQLGFPEQRLHLRSRLFPFRVGNTRERSFDPPPAPLREMGAQAPPQVDGLSDVQCPAGLIAQYIDAWRRRRAGADPRASVAPGLAPIVDDKRLRHEAAREIGRRIPDPEDFKRQTLMVRLTAHFRHAGQKAIP
jgi:hypothetical protein